MSLLKRAEKSGSKYLNPVPTTVGGFGMIWKLLPLFLRNREERTPKRPLGPFRTDTRVYEQAPESGLRVTWFGHSGLLLEVDGYRVLVDPIWEQRASPVQFAGPKRFFAPTMKLDELPKLDAVLVSHDHYDHFGTQTLARLAELPQTENAVWVTSLGVGERLRRRGVRRAQLRELDWTESAQVGQLTLTAWPARHFSGRGVMDRFKTLWSSFVIEGPRHRVYFGADSGWWEGFAEIGAKYDGFDLTMLEVGAFHPLWASIHLGPENALRAYQALGGVGKAGLFMPIHWGLFDLALHGWRQPIEQTRELAEAQGVPLFLPKPGEPTEVKPSDSFSFG